MTTIVMNTINAAVTKWDWEFQSISPTVAGDASGLYQLGGALDGTAHIDTDALSGKTLLGDTRKKGVDFVHLAIKGDAGSSGKVVVQGEADEWEYEFALRAAGVSRAKAGMGISENYLALGHKNLDGSDFTLDRIEADVIESKQRRTIK
jgi:hypothetical protein